MIALGCPGCGKQLRVKDELASKKGTCPACGKPLVIPRIDACPPINQTPADVEGGDTLVGGSSPPRISLLGVASSPSAPGPSELAPTPVAGLQEETHTTPGNRLPQVGHGSRTPVNLLAPAQKPDEIGRLGPYRVLAVMGRGGMGLVFKAQDPSLERLVALKAMHPSIIDVPGAKQRFFREAKAAAALKHPHIVTIFQVGEDRGFPFLAMEFLEGESLEERLQREGRLSVAEILRIGRETAEGLAAAHARGLVHRDIKPANLWLEGKQGQVKILDFGLARALGDDSNLTQVGAFLGTPSYMAPEQADGKSLDPRADLFSLGCVLYRLCTGELPFKGDTTMAIFRSLAVSDPSSPSQLRQDVPGPMSDLVMRLLSKNPESRPASASAVAEILQALQQKPLSELEGRTQTLAPETAASAATRGRVAVLFAALLLLAGLASVGLWASGIIRFQAEQSDRGLENANLDPVAVKPGPEVVVQPAPEVLGKPGPDDPWLKMVPTLPRHLQVAAVEAKLKERNPGFRVRIPIWFGNDTVERLFVDNIKDLTPIRALTGLRTLSVNYGEVADLTPLSGMPLTDLTIHSRDVADLTPLRGMPLTSLYLEGSAVVDLTPLRGMPLTRLILHNNKKLTDVRPLAGLPLTHLNLDGTSVSNLSPLKGMKLTTLFCANTKVSDLSVLSGMPLRRLCYPFDLPQEMPFLRSFEALESINRSLAYGVAPQFRERTAKGEIPSLKTNAAADLTMEAVFTHLGHNEGTILGTPQFNILIRGGRLAVCFHSKKVDTWLLHPEVLGDDRHQPGLRTHVAAVKSADSLRLYVDGKLVAKRDWTGPIRLDETEPFRLGGRGVTMCLHEARISRCARYRADFTPQSRFMPDADTLALYHCDEGQGTVLKDASGNNHHATLTDIRWARGVLDLPAQDTKP